MPYDNRDEDTQQFTPTYPDEDFLEAVRELEIAGTEGVRERVGCTRQNAHRRLNQLVDAGELEHRKIGGRNVYTISS